MSVPAAFKTAINSKAVRVGRWLEIEGIGRCYGSFEATSDFFAARALEDRFTAIKPYFKSIPKNFDQQIDTLEGGSLTTATADFEVVDVDGILTQLMGVGNANGLVHLAADIGPMDTEIPYVGTAPTLTDSMIYIGTEAISVGAVNTSTKTFETCTRGMYRSAPCEFGKGYPVSPRPYVMANRGVWYNEVAIAGAGTPSLSSTEPDKCVRYSGTLKNIRLTDNDHGSYTLTIETMERELDQPCFSTLRQFYLQKSLMDFDGQNGELTARGCKGFDENIGNDRIYNVQGTREDGTPLFSASEGFIARVDNELIAFNYNSGTVPYIKVLRRAMCGTRIEQHAEGCIVQEVAVLVASGTASYEQEVSFFDTIATPAHDLPADHPLLLILQVALSTGSGDNWDGVGRNYDVLPRGWGMGLDVTRVDVEGIERAAAEEPNLRFGGIVQEPTNFTAFMRDILKMAGYYFLVTVGDKLTIRRLRPPMPDETSTAITNANRTKGFFTNWEANYSGAIRQITFKFGWDIAFKTYKRITTWLIDEADIYSKGQARAVTFESKFLYPGFGGIAGEPKTWPFDVDTWLLARRDYYRGRYGRPPPIIRERVDYSYIDSEVGDIVTVTHSNLPNIATGARGITGGVGEIVAKSIDDQAKVIEFTILMTGWSIGDYRYIGPAMKIATQDDNFTATITPNEYTASLGPRGTSQTDRLLEDGNGAQFDAFPADATGATLGTWPLRVWLPDFSSSIRARITAWNSPTQFVLIYDAAEVSTWTAVGNIVTANECSGNIEANTDTFAFMAADTDKLTIQGAEAAGHKYFPI